MTNHHNTHTITVTGTVTTPHTSVVCSPMSGTSPMHTLLATLAECSIITLHGICQRQRQFASQYRCTVHAQQREAHPQIFGMIHLHIVVVGVALVPERITQAVSLLPKYCPVHATLAHTCPITHAVLVEKDIQ